MRHVGYPSIVQFRNITQSITQHATYVGRDADDNPLYDNKLPKPVIEFHGTVKLHGANCSVSWRSNGEMWAQSRNEIITLNTDKTGFARFVEERRETIAGLFESLAGMMTSLNEDSILTIYGELVGKGIQKNTAIQKIDKAWVLFGARLSTEKDVDVVVSEDEDEDTETSPVEIDYTWIASEGLRAPEVCIFNIADFETFTVEVDFNEPEAAVERLAELTQYVENCCPVAKAIGGVDGTGEGIVWVGHYDDSTWRFKTKGKKHAVSVTRERVQVEPEKLASIESFVNYAVSENRFQQGFTEVFGDTDQPENALFGQLLAWVHKDILAEESDVLAANGLVWKETNGPVSRRVREMFMTRRGGKDFSSTPANQNQK